jgi:hypothetical protein
MTPGDPLLLRCLALTGSFETGLAAPACFGRIAGDFDGQGISYSALQWNIGRATLQPLLRQMLSKYPDIMLRVFGSTFRDKLADILLARIQGQLIWARSLQDQHHYVLAPWCTAFTALGATPEWQEVAMESAAKYFDQAKFQASQFSLTSDRALALLFDCSVQNGGVNQLAMHHALDQFSASPSWGEPEKMRCIAGAVADSANPMWRRDVLDRKLAIANGVGIVHGVNFDLAKDFAI